MSSSGAQNGIGGSDDAFVSFAFAIISVIALIVYLPFISKVVMRVVNFVTRKCFGQGQKRRNLDDDNPFQDLFESLIFVPSIVWVFVKTPAYLASGLNALLVQKGLLMYVCLPKVFSFCFRPKIILLWLWLILFSSAMYTTLTFDAHKILAIAPTASTSEIKKAYRSLSKMYHPDLNKTEDARGLYLQVRKAYKSLVDKDAFEEEMKSEELAFGVGLPSFLTSRENETMVLFGLLAILLGVPAFIWYKYGRSENKVMGRINRISVDQERIRLFLGQLGIPEDPKMLEKTRSRKQILDILCKVGLQPVGASEKAVDNFPPVAEFVNRCKSHEKYVVSLTNLGFDAESQKKLSDYLNEEGDAIIERFNASAEEKTLVFSPVSQADYVVITYLMRQHLEDVNLAIEELQKEVPSALRSARSLETLHREIFDYLELVYEREKPQQRHVQALIEVPRKVDDLVDELLPEVQKIFQKNYRKYLEANGVKKRQMRATQ